MGFLMMAGVLISFSGCYPTRSCVAPLEVSAGPATKWTPLRTHAGEALSETIRGSVRGAGPKPMNVLILSGGGQYGAFGAGFLSGLAAREGQPNLSFDVVTGISTGALQATFAFLGPEHYERLRETYTGVTQEEIIRERRLFGLLRASSLMDASPLRSLVGKYITMQVLYKVAEAYEGGRLLYIGTVNLDTGDFVAWNMGKIAARRMLTLSTVRKHHVETCKQAVFLQSLIHESQRIRESCGSDRWQHAAAPSVRAAHLAIRIGPAASQVSPGLSMCPLPP